MTYWVGVTDSGWYEFLRERRATEANFWQPSTRPLAGFLSPGSLFLFKLRGSSVVAGGGFFVHFTTLPISLAWSTFQESNGVDSLRALVQVLSYIPGELLTPSSLISCNVLAEPCLFADEDWIPAPSSWAPNIVRGKTYNTDTTEGAALQSPGHATGIIETRTADV